MHTTSFLPFVALLAATNANQFNTISSIAGSNSNGVATYNGYVCTGAIYVGCNNNIADAFCCVGAYAQQNICNSPQPTTCSQGSYVPLTKASTVHPTGTVASVPASGSAQPTSASVSGSASAAASTSSSASTTSSTGAAATANVLSSGTGAGILALIAKIVLM